MLQIVCNKTILDSYLRVNQSYKLNSPINSIYKPVIILKIVYCLGANGIVKSLRVASAKFFSNSNESANKRHISDTRYTIKVITYNNSNCITYSLSVRCIEICTK